MQYDSIILGSGLSGLTSALLLARSGRRVLVLEQSPQPAPVVRGFFRGGHYFDSGFHYAGGLGEGGAFRPHFRHLGLEEKLELFPFDALAFDRLKISATGETFSLPVGFSAIKAELGNRFPQVRAEIEYYLDGIEDTWSRYPYLDLDLDTGTIGLTSVHGPSLAERLKEFSAYPELQSLLSMHCLLYGVSPDLTPVILNSQVTGSYYHSVHGIVGGGRALVNAFLDLLAEAGVEVRCQAEVRALRISAGAICGVRLANDEEIDANEVIATCNPALLPDLLPQGALRPAYLKRLKNLRQTASAYIMFAKSRQPLNSLRGSNLFVQAQAGVFSADTECPLEERSFYLAAADQGQDCESDTLVGIVPASYAEVAEWESPGKRRSAEYRQQKEQTALRLRRLFIANCPELAEMEILDFATPLTLRDYSLAPQGAIYGVGRFLGQYNPQPQTRLPGLYLSGQAIAAPGLLGTVIASYLTCGSILGHELLRGELKACR
jgi:all-trans-retinol 13,14-reductase